MLVVGFLPTVPYVLVFYALGAVLTAFIAMCDIKSRDKWNDFDGYHMPSVIAVVLLSVVWPATLVLASMSRASDKVGLMIKNVRNKE